MTHTPSPWAPITYATGWTYVIRPADDGNDLELCRVCPTDNAAANARLIAAAPALLAALRIGLHHTQRAAAWTKDAYRRAIEEGMHGNAANHHQAWQDTLQAVKVIEAAIAAAEGEA